VDCVDFSDQAANFSSVDDSEHPRAVFTGREPFNRAAFRAKDWSVRRGHDDFDGSFFRYHPGTVDPRMLMIWRDDWNGPGLVRFRPVGGLFHGFWMPVTTSFRESGVAIIEQDLAVSRRRADE